MKIIITGSLGNISRPLTQKLVAAGHQVTVITHNPNRVAEIESLKASAALGSVEDIGFLTSTFAGAHAVYTMVPPNFAVPDYKAFSLRVGQNYASAIQQAGLKYVVNLSSAGSPLAGKGPLTGYQNLEESIDQLKDVHVMHLRPGGFYSNFYGSIGMIKHQGMIGNNFDETVSMVLSHPHDIAAAAFEALNTCSFRGTEIKYIVSDQKNGKEIAEILVGAINQPNLKWVAFSDEQLLQALIQNGFSANAAQHYIVDMGIAMRQGLLEEHYRQNKHAVYGKIGFDAFAKEFAMAYLHS